jgi:hypothetical protein
MKKALPTFVLGLFLSLAGFAQTKVVESKKPYWTSGGEWIFSSGTLDNFNNVVRFSPVINLQSLANFDKTSKFGWFTGVNIRNVGFIYDESATVRKKVRNYNLGIPIGLKFGNLDKSFFFGGYELEMALNYRERRFENEVRTDRFSVWFSDRVNFFQHALFVGVALPRGTSIKAKYYLTSFYNQDFQASDGSGNLVKPYQGIDANIFYISLNFSLFKNWELNDFSED